MFKNKSNNKKLKLVLISFFIIIITFGTYFIGENNFLRNLGKFIDDISIYQYNYGVQKTDGSIVIIKIDNKTLEAFQEGDLRMLGFSKELYAKFLDIIFEKYKANIVGLDIIFSNKSIYGEKDENILKETLEKYKDRVVISTRGDNKDVPLCIYNNVEHGASEWIVENKLRKFNIVFDDYNINDKCREYYEGNDKLYSFVIELYKKYIASLNKSKANNYSIALYNFLNNQKNNEIYTRFFDSGKKYEGTIGYESYSMIDIINGIDIDLEGKTILLGEVGTLLHDRQFSPIKFTEKMSGIEFIANGFETIKRGIEYKIYKGENTIKSQFLFNIDKKYIFIILVITLITLIFVIVKYNIYISLFVLFLLFSIHLTIGTWIYLRGYIYPLFFFVYSLIVCFITIYVYKYSYINKQKNFIKKAFGLFVSPEIADIISNDPDKLNLKGKQDDIVIFFSDIESFTSISESTTPETLFTFLNEYFSLMTNILIKNKGTLDKYIGDAVMGFFNAPINIDNPEYKACLTAIEQIKAVKILNIKWSRILKKNLNIRIGINSGISIHGNIGSSKKINYTVIGDNVNLASRLEGINKEYGTNIVISQNVYKNVKNDFVTRELDTIKVKGKNIQTKIYELISLKNKNVIDEKILNNYEKGLKYYYKGEYQKAIIEFEKNTIDNPSKKLLARINLIIEGKLEVNDGFFKMKTK